MIGVAWMLFYNTWKSHEEVNGHKESILDPFDFSTQISASHELISYRGLLHHHLRRKMDCTEHYLVISGVGISLPPALPARAAMAKLT